MTDNTWQNRIIGLEWKPANQLLANPKNPRVHPAFQRESLRGSLDSIGWYDVVIENRLTGELIDGHARVEEALTKDDTMLLPVLVVEMAEHEQDLALLTHDAITYLATYDRDKLAELQADVNTDDTRLQMMIADQAEKQNMYLSGDSSHLDLTPDQRLEIFENATIKQVVLYFGLAEYDDFLERLEKIMAGNDIEDNTSAVLFLLRHYEDNPS